MHNLYIKKSCEYVIICKNDKYTKQMKSLLKNPDTAFDLPANLLLKNGNSATLVQSVVDNNELVIKRYNMKTMLHAMRRAFKKSRADHSWKYAHIIKEIGINTPYPIAMKEKRYGVFRNKAFFICNHIDGPTAFDYFKNIKINHSTKAIMAKKIIKMLNTLKSSMITHGDMKATNIIIHENEPFILDLDSMKTHKSRYFFNRAWQKDMRRFMRNWIDSPDIKELFRQIQY